MEQLAKAYAHVSQAIRPLAARNALFLPPVLLGGALIALVLVANLVGLHAPPGRVGVGLALAGLAAVAIGMALDNTIGDGQTARWLKALTADREGVGRFLAVAVELGLLVLLVRQVRLENPAFYDKVMLLAFYGFLVHHLLPLRYRLPFFVALSLAGICGVLGLANGALLIGMGVLLIGLCHLPVSLPVRVAALVGAGGSLALLRQGSLGLGRSGIVLPVLASMFMFRLIVYLYDLSHRKEPVSAARTLAYFFLLPNVVFPLFPVVDYNTFSRNYYGGDPYHIYQKGIRWMLRGIVQLLLYRYVDYYLVIGPEDVSSPVSLARYMISNLLFLLRLSGQFHLIVGMLHLFGFDLPETMDRYFLASSFIDFWRRANIYWKNFMQKVFFYPVYFRLRTRGPTTALVLSMLTVFVVTWFFHSYQWFWLRGTFQITGPDVLYWALFGVLVLANSLYEDRYGRQRSLRKVSPGFGGALSLALRTMGTFTVICLLWSVWISSSLSEWVSLWPAAGLNAKSLAAFLPAVLAAFLVFWLATLVSLRMSPSPSAIGATSAAAARPVSFFGGAAWRGALALALYLAATPAVYFKFGGTAQELMRDLHVPRLNARDAGLLERGYYENLASANRLNSQLWQIYMQKPNNWKPLLETDAIRMTGDFLRHELRPSLDMVFLDAPFHTNRWGMRDRDYERRKASGTYRIAVIGGSHVMGTGVGDEETFEQLLEDRLNRENDRRVYARYEVLNFGVGGYSDLQGPAVLEKKALDFEPDAVLCVGHPRNAWRVIYQLSMRVREKLDIPYEPLRDVVRRAGIDAGTTEEEAMRRLKPFADEVISWAYRRIVDTCRQRGIVAGWMCLPSEAGADESKDAAEIVRLAREAGFIVLDFSDVYDGQKKDDVRLAPWDQHPNVRGHLLIANRLYAALPRLMSAGPARLSVRPEASVAGVAAR